MTRQKCANMLHYYVESRFSRDAPKGFKFVAFYVEKKVFS